MKLDGVVQMLGLHQIGFAVVHHDPQMVFASSDSSPIVEPEFVARTV